MFDRTRHLLHVAGSLLRERRKTKSRSPEWPRVRAQFLHLHPNCAACSSTVRLQVHHQYPFHLDPTKELDPTNLITLCMATRECHLLVGHLDDWEDYNPQVVADADHARSTPTYFTALQQRAAQLRAVRAAQAKH